MSLPILPTHSKNASYYSKNHQLNNEGCKCQLCQKVNIRQNMMLSFALYVDRQSERFNLHHHKQTYLGLLDQLMGWNKFGRKVRYSLPETCVFFGGMPSYLLTKPKDTLPIKLIRNKSMLNIFELQNFFLDGYLLHHPTTINKKREKHEWKQRMRQITVIAAKYTKNVTALLTLVQLGNMFKSKFKYMREDLMYLQTLVGGYHTAEYLVRLDLEIVEAENREVFDRAKNEAAMIVGEIKITDGEFIQEKDEIEYQKELRREDIKLYLTYLSLKIIFISSKLKPTIIKESVWKWSCVKGNDFLWDVRIVQQAKSSQYWQSSGMQALQIKLQQTMSMLQFGPEKCKEDLVNPEKLSSKAVEISQWLQKSTQEEWNQIGVIRTRLEKLQNQKKALLQSQKEGHSGGPGNRIFRMRGLKRRQTMNQSCNFQAQKP